jgi:hypothetical protein
VSQLADRVMVLRDEVLEVAERGERDSPAVEIFEAIVRAVATHGDTSPGLDLTLHDALARRLAWGDTEELVLGEAEDVFERLVAAADRALRDPNEEMLVIELAAEVVSGAARIVALSAVARAGRERSARLREEMAQRRLREALQQQKELLQRLEGSAP